MGRDAFLRNLRAYARANGFAFEWIAKHGKGSHGRVKVGELSTTVPHTVGAGLKRIILRQLGLPPDAV